jgi:hypothetical protein
MRIASFAGSRFPPPPPSFTRGESGMGDAKKCAAEFHDPVVAVYRTHVDRTLIQKNLKLSVEERFLQLMELQRFAVELREAGRRASAR